MARNKKIIINKKKLVIHSSKKNKMKGQLMAIYSKNKRLIIRGGTLLGVVLVLAVCMLLNDEKQKNIIKQKPISETKKILPEPLKINFDYPNILPDFAKGISYDCIKEYIVSDTSVKDFFMTKGLHQSQSDEIDFQTKFNQINKIKAAHAFYTFKSKDKDIEDFFIYEIALDSFAVITLSPKPEVKIRTIPILKKIGQVTGIVKTHSFWESFMDKRIDHELKVDILDALQWHIDFYHVQPNDKYKLIYEEKWYKNKLVGVGNLLAIYYQNAGKIYYAFRYKDKNKTTFFDEHGQVMKKRFLKTPVQFDIVNSAYNLNRAHPIHKKIMPHYGTDYFAKMNDPVFAVAKGKIIEARNRGNNGNYIKIFHDAQYQTQYLHLNSFADGIRPGKLVEQGQIIGYAGMTGAATGPHVCFRFWMNGKQVDHTKEIDFHNNGVPSDEVENKIAFETHRDSLLLHLDNMTVN